MSPRNDSPEVPEDDLRKLESAYRAAAQEEPPELLDLAVLNKARAAVEKPRRAWSFNLTWVHGLATAGVAVLALTLFMDLREQQPQPNDPARYDMQMHDARAAATASAPAEGADESAVILEEMAAEPEEAKQKADNAPALRRQLEADRDDALLKKEAEKPAPASPVQNATRDAAGVAASAVSAERQESRKRNLESGEPSPESDDGYSESLEQNLDLLEAQPDIEIRPPMVTPEPVDMMVCTRVSDTLERCYNRRLATKQFEELQQLRDTGEEAAFSEALAAFRKEFPDYPLPEDWPQ
jgi:hypothetical protein